MAVASAAHATANDPWDSLSGMSGALRFAAEVYDREVSRLLGENARLRAELSGVHTGRGTAFTEPEDMSLPPSRASASIVYGGNGEMDMRSWSSWQRQAAPFDVECLERHPQLCYQQDGCHAMISEPAPTLSASPEQSKPKLTTSSTTFLTTSGIIRQAEKRQQEKLERGASTESSELASARVKDIASGEKPASPAAGGSRLARAVLGFHLPTMRKQQPRVITPGMRFMESRNFQVMIGLVILLNALHTAVEADMGSLSDGSSFMYITDAFFTLFFAVEIFTRLLVYKKQFFCNEFSVVAWNILESALALISLFGTALSLAGGNTGSTGALTTLRMVRFLKVARVVRVFHAFRELRMLLDGIVNSLRVLTWSCLFLLLVTFVIGIFTTFEIGQAQWIQELPDAADRENILKHWSTTARSMFTLYQLQTGDSWASAVARPIVERRPWLALFFVSYTASLNICVMNVIVAIMVENVLKSTISETEEEKGKLALESQQKICIEILKIFHTTAGSDRSITRDEWFEAMGETETKTIFAGLGVSTSQLETMFDIVDVDGSGEIDLPEFIEALKYGLRDVKSMDVNGIQVDLWRLNTSIQAMSEVLDEHLVKKMESIQQLLTSMIQKEEGDLIEKMDIILREIANLRADVFTGVNLEQ